MFSCSKMTPMSINNLAENAQIPVHSSEIQYIITLKMADKERSDLCIVSTMTLCAPEFKQTLISLLFQVKGL